MSESKKDPICGMEGHIDKYDHFFCSENCIKEYEKKKGLTAPGSPWPRLKSGLILFNLALAVLLIYVLRLTGTMIPFMGAAFIILAGLKLLDLKGFASAFAMYDVVAKRSHVYGLAYPFIELGLGLAYSFKFRVDIAAWVTLVIMSVGIVGVTRNLMSKNPIRCACLGTLIKVPLTKFTFFEDLFMIAMALMIIFQI